jgi:hypothetical protein
MIVVERKNGFKRKKLQHQSGSLAAVVSGGGQQWGRPVLCHTVNHVYG